MSTGKIKPARMKRPKLPEKATPMECVKWIMYARKCSEAEAKRLFADAVDKGKLSFEATRNSDGVRGMFRVRDGRVVMEH